MATLARLHDEAQDDKRKRHVVLRLTNGVTVNAEFLDPYLGALRFDHLPGQVMFVADLSPHEVTGQFVDRS